jgi:hypothetical protein
MASGIFHTVEHFIYNLVLGFAAGYFGVEIWRAWRDER